jgi:thiol-disulfide isomerase/thioredoxin
MKNITISIILLGLILYSSRSSLSQRGRMQNFPLYNLDNDRYLINTELSKLPPEGVLILNFTSIHCLPCKKEIPELLDLVERKGNKARIFFIYAESDRNLVRRNAVSLGIKGVRVKDVCIDLFNSISTEFGIKSMPYTIVAGRNGDIISRYDGYCSDTVRTIENLIH